VGGHVSDVRITYNMSIGNPDGQVPFGRATRRDVEGRIILKWIVKQ
jgi:hypothetical protein